MTEDPTPGRPGASKTTAPTVAARKATRGGGPPLVMVTAYDTPFARLVDEAGVDVVLVGDSVADNVLGLERTLEVDLEVMVHHVAAVARARPRALLVADLPWMTYHLGEAAALEASARLVRAGAEAVKLEGAGPRLPVVRALVDAGIPVMGHLGLTPQSVHALGGMKVQARTPERAEALAADAKALAGEGCFALVLEAVPDVVAARVTAEVDVPTIGIGAGAGCDGQVLVLHDLLGLRPGARTPRFARRYAELGALARSAVAAFAADVRSGAFPAPEEAFAAGDDLAGFAPPPAPPPA